MTRMRKSVVAALTVVAAVAVIGASSKMPAAERPRARLVANDQDLVAALM